MNMQPKIPTAPIILTDKQEKFCLLIVEGKSGREAYRIAYGQKRPQHADVCASRTLRSIKVQQRIAQLRAGEAAALRVTVQSVTEMLVKAYDLGMAEKQVSAASQAAMGLAKLHGFLIERHQVDAVIRKPSMDANSPDEMTEEQWIEEHGIVSGLIEHDPDEGFSQGGSGTAH